jgi:hypothetical protein
VVHGFHARDDVHQLGSDGDIFTCSVGVRRTGDWDGRRRPLSTDDAMKKVLILRAACPLPMEFAL